MKKNILILSLLTLGLAGCSQEELIDNNANQQPTESKIFTATLEEEDAQSRIYVGNDNKLFWTAQDQISIFAGNTVNSPYQKTEDTEKVTFTTVKTTSTTTGSDLSNNYAVYPYNEATTISAEGVITTTLPATQKYAENSFGLGDNTMVAVTNGTEDYNLGFKNVCGYLKLQLYGTNVTVKTVTLTGNNSEKLAGKATVTLGNDGLPTVEMADDTTTSITLDCGNGVTIGDSENEATTFWMVVPPTTFTNGFTITVTTTDNEDFSQTTSKKIEIKRKTIIPMRTIKVNLKEIPYITFSAPYPGSFTLSKAVETLEYSVNGEKWKALETNNITFGGTLGDLRIRGNSSIGTATYYDNDNSAKIIYNSDYDQEVSCTGDIRTLIDYKNYLNANTQSAKFCNLFSGFTQLATAPKLPAMTLTDFCYYGMFENCKSLTEAPQLPAEYLSQNCYACMFLNCTSLSKAPELNSENIYVSSYGSMFEGCTNLTQAPELPAMELSAGCYARMFSGCTKLSQAPELKAQTLAPQCYESMFQGCTSLTQAPELKATDLAEWCYANMFLNCHYLIQGPELPATILAEYCYYNMFGGCARLEQAPKLAASVLVSNCYEKMFEYCQSLTSITMLATDITANSCLDNWLQSVTSNGTFYKHPDMNSLPTGTSGIPNNWKVEDYNGE